MNPKRAILDNLKEGEKVIDLCAGIGHWLNVFKGTKIGVEINNKYKKQLEGNGYKPVIKDVKDYTFEEADAIIWIDGIEHLKEKDALEVLERAEKHCSKMMVFTPNEFNNNKENAKYYKEPLQEHLSLFPETFWIERGYEKIYTQYNKGERINNNLYIKRFEK